MKKCFYIVYILVIALCFVFSGCSKEVAPAKVVANPCDERCLSCGKTCRLPMNHEKAHLCVNSECDASW